MRRTGLGRAGAEGSTAGVAEFPSCPSPGRLAPLAAEAGGASPSTQVAGCVWPAAPRLPGAFRRRRPLLIAGEERLAPEPSKPDIRRPMLSANSPKGMSPPSVSTVVLAP